MMDTLTRAQAALRAGDFARAARLVGPLADGDARARVVLVNALMMQRRFAEALPWIDRLLAANPAGPLRQARAHALNGLGVEKLSRGEVEAAEADFRAAVDSDPGHRQACFNLALCHLREGRYVDARPLLEPLLNADADAETRVYAAAALAGTGEQGRAIELLKSALDELGEDAELLERAGDELVRLFQYADAAYAYEAAARASADDARIILKAASARSKAGNVDAAETALRALHQRDPENLETLESLVHLYIDDGRPDSMPPLLNGARVPFRVALGALATAVPLPESEAAIEADRSRVRTGLERLADAGTHGIESLRDLHWNNFYLAYHGRCNLELNQLAGRLLEREIEAFRGDALTPPPTRGRRIGFLSSHWGNTVVGSYFGPWIRAAAEAGLEPWLLNIPVGYNVPTPELTASASVTLSLDGDPDRRLDQLRELGLAAVVIPELGADVVTMPLAASRIAPVQLAGWGHPETSGLPSMDGFFSAASMEPGDGEAHYSESLLPLPGLGTCYPNPAVPLTATRADFGLPDSGRLYLFPHSPFKVHPQTLAVMTHILEQDPGGRLLLFKFHEVSLWRRYLDRLETQLREAGLDPEDRLVILPFMDRTRFLNVVGLCDVMIDNIHYSGGNSSLDALAMGLPVVTWPRRMMRGRQTAGMLNVAGHPELVAADEQDFITRCIEVARDYGPDRAERLRADVAAELFDDQRPLKAFGEHLLHLIGD